MVNIVVVGIGGYGRTLLDLLLANQDRLDCRVVAAADTRLGSLAKQDQAIAARLSAQGAELFDDAIKMYAAWKGRAQAAYVATGIPSHEPLAIAAMEAGFHLHLEKPPAATAQEVDRILDASARTGRMILVGFHFMHSQTLHAIKQRLLDGRLGPVQSIGCWALWPRDRRYFTRNDWSGRLRSGRRWVLDGPMTNALAHEIANLLYLCGPTPLEWADPAGVRAELYAAGPVESHDTAAVEIIMAGGARTHFLATHCCQSPDQVGPNFVIQAQRGRVVYDHETGAAVTYADGTGERIDLQKEHPRAAMIQNFVEAVRAGDASILRCPLEQARKMVLVADAAHESSGTIHRIGPEFSMVSDADSDRQRTHVAGIDAAIERAAREGRLLSDLDDPPPWAVRTTGFDPAGYRQFPKNFRS